MTSDGKNFNDFLEIVPTREITTKIEKTFSFSRPWPWAYFLNVPSAAARGVDRCKKCGWVQKTQSTGEMKILNSAVTKQCLPKQDL